MKEWYCIIKGRSDYGWTSLIKDKVFAEQKEEARQKVRLDLGIVDNIPFKIRNENVKPESIIIQLYEMKKGEYQAVHSMFFPVICKQCQKEFIPVDSFNLFGRLDSYEFCNHECKAKYKEANFKYEDWNVSIPVIYKITYIPDNLIYIGKTIRSFTLRWWEHIKWSGDTDKFHSLLKNTRLEDWSFKIEEVIEYPSECIENEDKENYILDRERYYINLYDTVNNGLNSI